MRTPAKGGLLRRVGDILLSRVFTVMLATFALILGVATFVLLAGGGRLGVGANATIALVLANLVVLLPLGLVLIVRLVRVWLERRRGSAGSRLHVRLVVLFGVVAVTPAIVVAAFATLFFHFGIQTWFNDTIRTALHESLLVSRGYLEEHRNHIRADVVGMANDLTGALPTLATNSQRFNDILFTQTVLRGLTDAVIYDPATSDVLASTGNPDTLASDPPPADAVAQARQGEAVVFGTDAWRVRAIMQMESEPAHLLLISRPIDPQIVGYIARTEDAVVGYDEKDQNNAALQVTFVLIFAVVALLVLSAAVLVGLVMANQIARPIGHLIGAAERVRDGDLSTRVPEIMAGDEVAALSRAFNRMTGQLSAQRGELMDAYGQIDARRRFTEAVLSGVSAGVIGLDPEGAIELPNRAASALLGVDLVAAIGQPLAGVAPEFAPLIAAARAAPERARTAELEIGPPQARRMLLVRIGADQPASGPLQENGTPDNQRGFVATFDDITELQSAQRKAAWADVARRIAHEIKNPLTPIQLAAERLKRRFAREITSDPDTFTQCADTIIRSVGDIGRMVDEFSAFARMPLPVMKPADLSRIVREAMVLQRHARPEIAWSNDLPERAPEVICDRRLIGQALTNLLQNAADGVMMGEAGRTGTGAIHVAIEVSAQTVRISVTDNGIGLPQEDRQKLTEPYVTHKPKGTGLGLAIVKKILEDHGGRIMLEDNMSGDQPEGAVASLILPLTFSSAIPALGAALGNNDGA